MRLLVCLAEHGGEVVSIEQLLDEVWSGVTVTPDSVYQAVASLRRLLGDDPKDPAYIATVPRLGYRLIADVAPWADPSTAAPPAEVAAARDGGPPIDAAAAPEARRRTGVPLVVGFALTIVVGYLVWFAGRAPRARDAASAPAAAPASIAVVPFLDLTDKMNHELFVDGMTEELIDKLSKVPGLRVPSARSSFALKGKHLSIGDISRTLGTTYVLDGSVRKTDSGFRIAATLSRGDSGFVVWSATYDRPSGDLVTIEDDIAGEVARSLSAIPSRPNG